MVYALPGMKKLILTGFLGIGFATAVAFSPTAYSQEGGAAAVPVVVPVDGPVLTVEIKNVLKQEGKLMVGIFDRAESFTDDSMEQSTQVPVTEVGDVIVEVPGLPPGKYAVVVYHDYNGNSKLDKNFVGMPKEPYAFSNHEKTPLGTPDFETCIFEFTEAGGKITLTLPGKK